MIDNFEVWKKTVISSKEQGYDVIIVGLYHIIKDNTGKHVNAEKVLEWTSKNTPIPPFAFWDFSVGPDKTIGGYVILGKEQGKAAGNLALRMLSDNNFTILPPITAKKGRLIFSASQLKKWGVTLTEGISVRSIFTE